MNRPARATIDLEAIRHNVKVAKRAAPQSRVLAAVKADAYGHGLTRVLSAFDEADALAVASVEEAVALRAVSDKDIVVLQGIRQPEHLALCAKHALQPVFHQSQQLDWLSRWSSQDSMLSVWLKVDSGMHRLGFDLDAVERAFVRLSDHAAVNRVACMTHMACADDRSDDYTLQQIKAFERVTADLSAPRSAANSACVLGWPQAHYDWVRPGIMLYGASPFIGDTAQDWGLQPAMRLTAPIVAIKHCQKGDAVGYGRSWVCPKPMTLGVVAIGYGDGYPRHANNQTPAWVKGHTTHLVGRVSMDMIAIDLTGYTDVSIDDEVVLWGPELPAETVAASLGSISYELFCHIHRHVAYEYRG